MVMKSILRTFVVLMTVHPVCWAGKEVFTPENLLPAGVDSAVVINPYTGESGAARKGTVAATLNNIALLNTLLLDKNASNDSARVQEIKDAIISLVPSLKVIGVFDLFSPEEWLLSDRQPGRVLAAVLYLQTYPEAITAPLKERLLKIQGHTHVNILSESIEKTLSKINQ